MKSLKKYTIVLSVFAITLMSCDNLLDNGSERFLTLEQNQINSVNDTIYSMVGILSKLQPIATQYVLLGELRGDLMKTRENARLDLQQISNFEVDEANSIVNQRDYYEVIKHCNYLIHNIDTSIVLNTKKVMYKEYAAAKAIRAWTYMQLALNFETVTYIEQPFLSINDTEKDYPVYTFSELAPVLIEELEPIKDIDKPGPISLGSGVSTYRSFFPVNFILGDLYLWLGDYENAAQSYYNLIYDNGYYVSNRYKSEWLHDNEGMWYQLHRWPLMFDLNQYQDRYEIITQIASSVEFGDGVILDSISLYKFEITPSQEAIENWESATYYHDHNVIREGGDLRGENSSFAPVEVIKDNGTFESNLILKYILLSDDQSKVYPVYRISMLYSRYAEAVNRLGKPNLAFAVLKNGLSKLSILNDSIVPPKERYVDLEAGTTLLPYLQFTEDIFSINIGIREHGAGNIDQIESFRIPSLATLEDSIEYVEDLIMEENALEFAFEGNRFHDLMRIALRRGDESYLANKVAARFNDAKKTEIATFLSNSDNWYLK